MRGIDGGGGGYGNRLEKKNGENKKRMRMMKRVVCVYLVDWRVVLV